MTTLAQHDEVRVINARKGWIKDHLSIELRLKIGEDVVESIKVTTTRHGHHRCHSVGLHAYIHATKFYNPT